MKYTADFSTLEKVRQSFDTLQTNRPNEQDWELIPDGGLRLWCIPWDGTGEWTDFDPLPNPRFIDGRNVFEPVVHRPEYQVPFGSGYLEMTSSGYARVGEDVPDAMRAQGAKFPFGWLGEYDLGGSGYPTDPPPGGWAALLWHSPFVNRRAQLAIYGYKAGDSMASAMMIDAFIVAGDKDFYECSIKMNTTKNPRLIPTTVAEAVANANPDGKIRVRLNGVTVFERNDIPWRGDARANIQCAYQNYYQGGRPPECLPSKRCHIDLWPHTVESKYDVIPTEVPPTGGDMNIIVYTPSADDKIEHRVGTPPTTDNGEKVKALWDTIDAMRAQAQKDSDNDNSNKSGDGVLAVPLPPRE